MHPQLVLSLDTAPATSFENFLGEADAQLASASIAAMSRGESEERQIYVRGERGTGKTHLLAAACQTTSALGYRIAYLPGELANERGALEGLENCELVCIDDLQRLDHRSESALLHCIDRCREGHTRLLFAADRSIGGLGLELPGLATRLAWGPVFQIEPLLGQALFDALAHEFRARALVASDEVLELVLARCQRDLASLKHAVDLVDAASLSERKRITLPFVKRVLGEAGLG